MTFIFAVAACALALLATGSLAAAAGPATSPRATTTKKLCVVKKRNSNGKLVTVYKTKVVKRKVRRNGKLVTVKKRVFVYRTVTKKVKVRKNGKLVTVKKRVKVKVPEKGPCKTSNTVYGTPITVNIDEGSVGNLDFGAFVREAPLAGTLRGYIVGALQLGKPNTINLTSGRIDVNPTPVFIDDKCGGDVTAAIRTGPETYALLDQTRSNTASLSAEGVVTTVASFKLRSTIELRNGDTGCNNPYLQTGYLETSLVQRLIGKLTSTGGLGLKVKSAPQLLEDFAVCLSLGDPNEECSGLAVPFPFLFSANVTASIKVGKAGNITVPKTVSSAARG
ncbi:MAG TPA: hypothetical protein VF066_11485 [Thermoleophilaceae bacterium]